MKVSDMTVEEFTGLIESIIERKLSEYFNDPDEGLELKDELREYLESHQDDTDTISFDQVKSDLYDRKII
ncbi:MAG: hypothetical protein SFH39_07305 [Candidatus Magnetobacterium sp. LHC-1]|nr:hypothetical protein [Nitrospirota bacterium]